MFRKANQHRQDTARDETERDETTHDEKIVRSGFWPKFRRVAAQLPFAEELVAAYYCAFDRNTPRHVQVALLGALAYFVLPFDAVPDMLLLVGFADDAAVLAAAVKLVSSHITPAHWAAARAALRDDIAEAA